MSDLISRKAAIDAIHNAYKSCPTFDILDLHNATVIALNALPSAEPQIIRCEECKHKPIPTENYDSENFDCGYELVFPDYRCPCQCDDAFYSWMPDDDWTCGFAERMEVDNEPKAL